MKSRLLSHSFSRRTLLTLMFGSIIIIFIISLLLSNIWIQRFRLNDYFLTQRILHTIKVINKTPKSERGKLLRLTRLPHVRMKVLPINKTKSAFMLLQPSPKHVATWLRKHRKQGKVYIQINNNEVLYLQIHDPYFWHAYHPYFQFTLIGILLLLELALCVWAISRMHHPFVQLNNILKEQDTNDEIAFISGQKNDLLDSIIKSLNSIRAQTRKLQYDRMQMLAAISHDLRTPLTRIKLRSEYFEDSPEYPKILDDIKEMEAMISDVLSFAKLDTQLHAKQHFDLNALLDSLSEDLQDAGFDVTYENDPKRVTFLGSIQAIKRALSNLITNAATYGKKATVTLHQEANQIVIHIDDIGPGISSFEIEKVFMPFYRVEQSRSRHTGGSGLGLYIAKEIIQSHQGTIKLINKPEGGLRVEVVLPV